MKEEIKEVKKVWGRELQIVNNGLYCGKLLYLDKGATSSLHLHKKKQETFYCIRGQVILHISNKDYMLNPYSRPKTIMPGELHQFHGITDAVIIEFSTHDDPEDTFREIESQSAS